MKGIKSEDIWGLRNLTDVKSYHKRLIFTEVGANSDKSVNDYRWTLCTLEGGRVKRLASFDRELNFVLVDIAHAMFVDRNIVQEIDLNTGMIRQLDRIISQAQLTLVRPLQNGKLLLAGKINLQRQEKDYQVLDELPTHFNGQGVVNKERQHLFIYDLETCELTDLIPDLYFHVHDFYVSGSTVYIAGDSYHKKRPVIPSLYRLNLISKEFTRMFGPGEFDVSTSMFFNQMFFLKERPYLLGNDDARRFNKNPQFFSMAADGSRKLAAKWDRSLGSWVNTDQAMGRGNVSQVFNDRYYFVSTVVDHAEIFCFNGSAVSSYFKFLGSIVSFSFVGKDQFFFAGLEKDQPEKLYFFDRGQVRVVYDPNQALLKGRYLAVTKRIDYTATQESKQHGWVLYPKDYQEGRRYPGILEIHGGPKTAYGEIFFHEMQVFASAGYFVFFCNIHGSDGQGNDFADISGHWGEDDFKDLMLFTDQVLKQVPVIDPHRLGVAGGSYGGFMTNWVIGHTTRFSAACSQRSIANGISQAYLSDIGPDDDLFENQATIDEQAEVFWQHSPLKFAAQVKTPTLFINSDQDFRCPEPEGMQMLHALLWHGVPARMCLFHGESHELSRSGRPAHRVRRLNEMLDWFDRYLK